MPDTTNLGQLSRRCKVCQSPLQEEIDLMLLGETRHDDGMPWRYEEIVDWCSARGFSVAEASLSRHRTNHLMPSVQASLEVERQMEAISKATGKQLSIHSALMNTIVMKVIRRLDDDDLDGVAMDKILRVAVQASRTAMNLKKAEVVLNADRVKEIAGKLSETGNMSPEALRAIRRDLYGLIDEDDPDAQTE